MQYRSPTEMGQSDDGNTADHDDEDGDIADDCGEEAARQPIAGGGKAIVKVTAVSIDVALEGGQVAASMSRIRATTNKYAAAVENCSWLLATKYPTIKAADRRIADFGVKAETATNIEILDCFDQLKQRSLHVTKLWKNIWKWHNSVRSDDSLVAIIDDMAVLRPFLHAIEKEFNPLLLLLERRACAYATLTEKGLVSIASKTLDYKKLCEWFDQVVAFRSEEIAAAEDPPSVAKLKKQRKVKQESDDDNAQDWQKKVTFGSDDPIAASLGAQCAEWVVDMIGSFKQRALGRVSDMCADGGLQWFYNDMIELQPILALMELPGPAGEEAGAMVKHLAIMFQCALPEEACAGMPSPADVIEARQNIDLLAGRDQPRRCCRS